MDKKTLVSVSIFYNNDKDNGFGFSLPADNYHIIKSEADETWLNMRTEFCNDDALAAYLIDQLKALGECKSATLTDSQQMLVVMNIIQLLERGYIENNEFNGSLMTYVDDAVAGEVKNAMYP